MKQAVFAAIHRLLPDYIRIWGEICAIESPTLCKERVDRVGEYVLSLAESLGFARERIPIQGAGDVFCFTLHPEGEGAPLCLSGHTDTVFEPGAFGDPPVTYDEDNIYGPGVTDCKGGIVAALLAMHALAVSGYRGRPVRLLLQSDEEMGSRPSQRATINAIIDRARDAVAFLNLEESHEGTLTIARKGILTFTFHIKGQAAHSSLCATMGASAILEASHKVIACEKWKDAEGITCNVGVIEGGTVPNAVPEECTFRANVRYGTPEEKERITAFMEALAKEVFVPGCTTELSYPPRGRICMVETKQNRLLAQRLNGIFEANGLPRLAPIRSLGGSDAADVTEAGIPCLDNFGTRGGWVHSTKEYGALSSLAPAAQRLALAALFL